MKKVKVVIYARVSTLLQMYDRQIEELREYADNMGYLVVKTFSEKISGARKVEERNALMDLLTYVEENNIDKILIYEASRLSRRVVDFLSIIEHLNEKKISLYIHNNNMETLTPTGDINPISNLVLGILANFNSLERSLISSRMQSGLKNYIKNGGTIGRKVGYRKSSKEMIDDYPEQIRLIRKGYSLRNIAKITNCSVNTVRKIKSLISA